MAILWWRSLAAAVALIGLPACATGREPAPVDGVTVDGDDRTLNVGVGFCGNVRVDVVETDDVVTLTAWGGADAGGDCASGATVVLEQPLGDRRVVDGSTGNEVVPS